MIEREKLISMVQAVQRNEENAATELYEAFQSNIYYHILKNVNNDAELAADLTQETFIEILQTIHTLQEPAAFVTWSHQIAYHKCTAYFRKRREILLDEYEDGYSVFDTQVEIREEFIPDEALDKEELKKTIQEMINELPEEQRSALLLRYFNEISVKEIAQIQGVSEGTVKSRLNYARKAIKQAVENYEKKNDVRLHCHGVVPLLLWFFLTYDKSEKIAITASAVSTAAATTATTATTAAATTTAASVSTATAVQAGAVAAGKVVATKVMAGIVAATVAVGGVAIGTGISQKQEVQPVETVAPTYHYEVAETISHQTEIVIETTEENETTETTVYVVIDDNGQQNYCETDGHAWIAATCSNPKTCSACGAVEGAAAPHSWQNATCTTPKTCGICGATQGNAIGHHWIEATHTSPKTCVNCGTTEGAALEHNWIDNPDTNSKYCTHCGQVVSNPVVTPDLPDAPVVQECTHSWTSASCTSASYCTKCGQTSGDALGHIWMHATHTSPKTCVRCGLTEGGPLEYSPEETSPTPTEPVETEPPAPEAGEPEIVVPENPTPEISEPEAAVPEEPTPEVVIPENPSREVIVP